MKAALGKENKKEGPLKGLKDKIVKESVKFVEKPNAGKGNKGRFGKFTDLRKWDAELERLDREEISIKNSLKEINHRIHEVVHRKEVVKSLSQITLPKEGERKKKIMKENEDRKIVQKESEERKKIDLSQNKISNLVNRNRSENRKKLMLNS